MSLRNPVKYPVKYYSYQDEQAFFDSYVQWHDQKGYWKQEDYFGNLI